MDSFQGILQALLSLATLFHSDLLLQMTRLKVKGWGHSLKIMRLRMLETMILSYLLELGFSKAVNIEGVYKE